MDRSEKDSIMEKLKQKKGLALLITAGLLIIAYLLGRNTETGKKINSSIQHRLVEVKEVLKACKSRITNSTKEAEIVKSS